MARNARVLLTVLATVLTMQAALPLGPLGLCAAEETARADAKVPAAIPQLNVLDVLKNDAQFAIFVHALESSGVDETLRGDGPYTIFAPTNDAFKTMNDFNNVLKNPDLLKLIVKHHIVPFGRTQSKDLPQLKLAGTLLGQDVHFASEPQLMVNDAAIVSPDLNADNGVVHAINRVLMPKIDTKMLEAARAEREAAPPPAAPALVPPAPAVAAAPQPEVPSASAKESAQPAKETVVAEAPAQYVADGPATPPVVTTTYYKDGVAVRRVDDGSSDDPVEFAADTVYRNFKHASHKFKKFFTGD